MSIKLGSVDFLPNDTYTNLNNKNIIRLIFPVSAFTGPLGISNKKSTHARWIHLKDICKKELFWDTLFIYPLKTRDTTSILCNHLSVALAAWY